MKAGRMLWSRAFTSLVIMKYRRNWDLKIMYPAGTWRLYNVGSTSMQRHDVASTLRRHCINVMCPLGKVRGIVKVYSQVRVIHQWYRYESFAKNVMQKWLSEDASHSVGYGYVIWKSIHQKQNEIGKRICSRNAALEMSTADLMGRCAYRHQASIEFPLYIVYIFAHVLQPIVIVFLLSVQMVKHGPCLKAVPLPSSNQATEW